jgi:hypothetical protein
VLERTWQALAKTSTAYHAVLRGRIENPDLSSAQLADKLSFDLGKPMTAVNVRKTLERAQRKFADLLVEEIAASLPSADEALVRQELAELDLLKYCGDALARRGQQA